MARLKMYCKKCGAGSEYTLEKPHFCQKCGNGFNSLSSTLINDDKPTQLLKTEPPLEQENEEESFNFNNLNKLSVDIEIQKASSTTIEDLLAEPYSGQREEEYFYIEPMGKEEFLEQFKREAGSLRRKDGS